MEKGECERLLVFDRFYRKTLKDLKRDIPEGPFSETEGLVFRTVAREPGLDRAGIAARLGVSVGTVSRAAKKLLSKGLLSGGKRAGKGLGSPFFLTEEGVKAEDGIQSRFKETAEKLGVSPNVVYYWVERGVIIARRINRGSPWWLTMDAHKERELVEWVRNSSRIQANRAQDSQGRL